jgi:hypothetical protein
MTDARKQALEKRAGEVADSARKLGLETAASTLKKMPVHSMPMRRDQNGDVFGQALTQQLFSQPQGGVVVGPSAKDGEFVVAQIADVAHPVPDFTNPNYAQFRGAVAQQLSDDMAQTIAAAARARVGVTTHPEAITALFGEAQQ